MSLVNDSLKFTSSDTQICWNFLLKKCSFCIAKATHIFSAKNIRILYIESAKTVNEMTLNELVKLTMLWTTGPRMPILHLHNRCNKKYLLKTPYFWTYVFCCIRTPTTFADSIDEYRQDSHMVSSRYLQFSIYILLHQASNYYMQRRWSDCRCPDYKDI